MDIFDCWIYVLNNMEHLKEIPFLDKYPVFRKLAAIGDLQKLTPEEREYYEYVFKVMRDLYATDKWEKEKRRRGMEKAWAEGMEKGMEKGDADRALADAKRFLDMGFLPEQVAKGTQLPLDIVLALKAGKMKN